MEHNNGFGSALGWLIIGSVAGACAALLLAPETGKRTRERVTRRFRETKDSVTAFTDDIAETTRDIAQKAERLGDKAVKLAGGASATAREVVDALDDRAARTSRR